MPARGQDYNGAAGGDVELAPLLLATPRPGSVGAALNMQ